ncbi:MAG: exonuclease SbcCD subunit D C-terminal domain-containing protein [Planctomycetes bacterium]|nr:exonuclease SbcCD subunit D C-terminal domain-containing protein [Planctomycetota bacterium]
MRILHTSDWHLGHRLHDMGREYEHQCFLDWLIDTVRGHGVDALLIAGDVFDTANPDARALQAFYRFLAEVRAARAGMQVVVVAGNHDGGARLEAPRDLLGALGVHVVGSLPRDASGAPDLPRLLVPLHDASGVPAALVVALPFLRSADLRVRDDGNGDARLAAVRDLHASLFAAARERAGGRALIAMGHAHVRGGRISEASERRIVIGDAEAWPAELFPDDLAYVALGHLHLAQAVAGREHVRYCGAPLPLSMGEAGYPHQVVLVEVAGNRAARIGALPVPRAVEFVRVPERGALAIEAALAALRALPARAALPEARRAFLEVCVALDGPEPDLHRRVAEALADRAPRLARLVVERPAGGESDAGVGADELADLDPDLVFATLHERVHGTPPAEPLRAAFRALRREVEAEAGA